MSYAACAERTAVDRLEDASMPEHFSHLLNADGCLVLLFAFMTVVFADLVLSPSLAEYKLEGWNFCATPPGLSV